MLRNDEDIRMIQTLIHSPIDCLIALLSLVALIFIIDRLGFLAWVAWVNLHEVNLHEVNRHEGNRHLDKPKDGEAKGYGRVHP
jgi:hypothetical protein